MGTMHTLSYIVITYNRKPDADRCLANLVRQAGPSDEIILVDNGSTDGTTALIRQRYPQVRVVALETNRGLAVGRNRGVEVAAREFLIFLDDDAEILTPDLGAKVQEYFERVPDLGLLAFTVLEARTGAEEYASIPRSDKRPPLDDYECSYFSGCGFAMRRRTFLDVGLFWDYIFYSGEELDLSYRLLDRGHRLLHTRAIRVNHWKVPSARPQGQYFYHNARNRPALALRYLPWRYVVTSTLFWWVYLSWAGLKAGELGYVWSGAWAAIRTAPAVLRQRRCVSQAALWALRSTKGRLWW